MFSGKPLPHAEYASDILLELTRRNVEVSKLDERALSFLRSNDKTSLTAIRDLLARGNAFLAGCDGRRARLLPSRRNGVDDRGRTVAAPGDSDGDHQSRQILRTREIQGTIEVGKRADLVLLEADPVTDIRNTRRIAAVLVRGRLLSKPDIDRIVAAHRRRTP